MKKSDKRISTIAYVIVAIFLVLILAMVIVHTNGFTTDFQTFYVNVNGDKVLEHASGYMIDKNNPMSVEAKYVFGKFISSASGYSVKVVPADDIAFDFIVGDAVHSFEDEADLSAGFIFEATNGGFTVASKGCVKQILSNVYPEFAVEIPVEMAETESEIFKLIVSSYNDRDTVDIAFGVSSVVIVDGIIVSNTEVVL